MKKSNLILAVFITSLLAAFSVHAQDYPASNFQPKVIFSSEPAVSATSASVAASATPCAPKAEQTAPDPNFPASSFQPKVIFSSADAK